MIEETIKLEQERRGFLSLLGAIVARPRGLFTYVRDRPNRAWLPIAIIVAVCIMLPPLASGPLLAERAREEFAANQEQFRNLNPGAAELDPEEIPAVIGSPVFTTIIPAVTVALGLGVGWLLWSAAIYLLSTVTGARNSFSLAWQVVVWSWVPYGIRALVQASFIQLSATLIENPGLSGFAPAAANGTENLFVPPEPGQLLLSELLSRIDIYLFWNLALLILGLTIISRFSQRKAAGIVILIWAIFTLVGLIPAVLLGSRFNV